MSMSIAAKTQNGFTLAVYPGSNKILVAMSLADALLRNAKGVLAGFAIWRTIDGKETILNNRLSFDAGVSKNTVHAWTPSDQAPFQKFRWVDVPAEGFDKPISYRVQARYFDGNGPQTVAGPELTVTVDPVQPSHTHFQPAFTRGFIASQAYATKFQNKDIRPTGAKTPDFDTKPFEAQYQWLGAEARVALFDFIADCEKDNQCSVDVFAYDLDEPDVIRALCNLGKQGKLRAVLDNAPLHVKSKQGGAPVEVAAAALIKQAAGADAVRQGHFNRFQHNKVFIKRSKDRKQAQRVLFGSMNFSVRGIYVQANNIIVADDATTAGFFAAAFDEAFKDNVNASAFTKNPISQKTLVGSSQNTAALPKFSLTLSPHKDANLSLGPVAACIQGASSSVLFAVMAPEGGGPVLGALRTIAAKPVVFSYGTVESDKGIAVQSPNGAMGAMTSFAALSKTVPPPFDKEFTGGPGMHIHDKFVVVDFQGPNATVFTGSSNLAAGGETSNGDSLVMIEDPDIAGMYAIEAIAMFDHFHFREKMQQATAAKPLTLWYPGMPTAPAAWYTEFYDTTKIQMRDRLLFARLPLPPGLATKKTVDWTATDTTPRAAPAAAKGGGAKKRASTPRTSTKAKSPRKKAATRTRASTAKKKSPTKSAPRRAATKKRAAAKPAKARKVAKKTVRKTRRS